MAGGSWVIGMILNVTGSLMVNGGTNTMKAGHNMKAKAVLDDYDPDSPDTQRPSLAAPEGPTGEKGEAKEPVNSIGLTANTVWRIGVTSFTVGSIVNFLSFAFAAQSLLASLGGVQFISNVFFSYILLGEKPSTRVLLATGIIVMGLCLAVAYSNHGETSYTEEQLIALYDSTYVTFLIIVIIVLACSEFTYRYYTKQQDLGNILPGNDFIRPVTYALVSATVGTQSVLQSKCIAELIKSTASGIHNAFAGWLFYILFIVFLAGVYFWLTRLNGGLKLFDGLVIIPLCQAFWTISAIVQGGMYFKEFAGFSGPQSIGFGSGVVLMLIGVYYLTPGAQSPLKICFKDGRVPPEYDPRTLTTKLFMCFGWKEEEVLTKFPWLAVPDPKMRRSSLVYGEQEMDVVAANPIHKDDGTTTESDDRNTQTRNTTFGMSLGGINAAEMRAARASSVEAPKGRTSRTASRTNSFKHMSPDQRRRLSSARAYTSDYLEAFFGPPSSIDAYGADMEDVDEEGKPRVYKRRRTAASLDSSYREITMSLNTSEKTPYAKYGSLEEARNSFL